MADIIIGDVTDGNNPKVNPGVFDHLMSSVELRLTEQFQQVRITGPQYAEVYLGAMQTTMAQAMQFVLQEQVASKQAELLEQQILTEVQTTARAAEEVTLAQKNILIAIQQELKLREEILHVTAQTALINAQKLQTDAQTAKIGKDEDLVDKQILSEVQKTLLITAQTAATNSEKVLTDQKTLSEVKNTLLIVAQTAKIGAETSILEQKELTEVEQTSKTAAETALLVQKTDTEKAQILDTVNTVAVAGVIGKQKNLFTAQTDGFARDAEQKVLKILLDTWNVGKTADDLWPTPTGIENLSLDAVITKAKAGISV